MPIYDFLCPACGTVNDNIYVTLANFETHIETCACSKQMERDLRIKNRRRTRSHKFPEFRLQHTKRLDGTPEGREIRSLADIRAFEREHQDSQVCVEAFSYDTEQHIPDPQSSAPAKRMTVEQKRDFIEKYRAMNIKNERSAQDYE